MRSTVIATIVVCAAAAALPSVAHEHATGIVKERMDAMTKMAKHHKAISDRIKAKRGLAGIKADAETIAELSTHIPHLFPPGSTQPPTEARRAIWQNWSDFEGKAKALETASRTLAETKPADAAAFRAAASAVTHACSACHEKYRARRR